MLYPVNAATPKSVCVLYAFLRELARFLIMTSAH